MGMADLVNLLEHRDKRVLALVNGVNKKVTTARRFDARINNLQLFGAIAQTLPDGQVVERAESIPMWNDHPDVQMIFIRRERYRKIEREIDMMQKSIDDGLWDEDHPKAKFNFMARIADLRVQQNKELTAIEMKLDTIRRWSSSHWETVIKMLTDMRKIVQSDTQHNDKMRLMEKKTSRDVRSILAEVTDSEMTDADTTEE